MQPLTSRKLVLALGGLAAITIVAVVSAWQPVPEMVEVLKYIGGISVTGILGQAGLDYLNTKNGKA